MIPTVACQEPDAGSSTVEYVVVLLVAAGFGAILYDLVTGGTVIELLTALVTESLRSPA